MPPGETHELTLGPVPSVVRIRAGLQRQVAGDACFRARRATLRARVPEGPRSNGPLGSRTEEVATPLRPSAGGTGAVPSGNEASGVAGASPHHRGGVGRLLESAGRSRFVPRLGVG